MTARKRRIALLGAPGTGRTTLATQLAAHLCASGAADIAVADGSALTVAIEAGALLPDDPQLHSAIEGQRRYDLTLLTGLDLGCTPEEAARIDARLREHLQRAHIPFQVVYGQGPQRLQSALQALAATGWLPQEPRAEERGGARWAWTCEKCSDPACEHRLFTRLKERDR